MFQLFIIFSLDGDFNLFLDMRSTFTFVKCQFKKSPIWWQMKELTSMETQLVTLGIILWVPFSSGNLTTQFSMWLQEKSKTISHSDVLLQVSQSKNFG